MSEALKTTLMAGGSFAIPAALTYLLSRRVNTAGMSRAQARVAEQIRERGLGLTVMKDDVPRDKFWKWLQYGGQKVFPQSKKTLNWLPPEQVAKIKKKDLGAILSGEYILPSTKRTAVLDAKTAPNPWLEDKWKEYTMALKRMGGIKTERVSDVFKDLPEPSLIAGPGKESGLPLERRRANQLIEALSKRYPKGWIVKPVGGASTGGSLPMTGTNFKKLFKRFGKLEPTTKVPGTGLTPLEIDRLESQDYDAAVAAMYGNPNYRTYRHLMKAVQEPEKSIVQPLIKLKRSNPVDNWYAGEKTFGRGPGKEFRVHALGGRVILGTSFPRFSALGYLKGLAGFADAETAGAESYVSKLLKKMPKKYRNQMYGFDVGLSSKNKYFPIETNPGFSGYIWGSGDREEDIPSAIAMNRLISAVQGRATVPLALMRSALAGTAGLGSYGAYRAGKALMGDEGNQNA